MIEATPYTHNTQHISTSTDIQIDIYIYISVCTRSNIRSHVYVCMRSDRAHEDRYVFIILYYYYIFLFIYLHCARTQFHLYLCIFSSFDSRRNVYENMPYIYIYWRTYANMILDRVSTNDYHTQSKVGNINATAHIAQALNRISYRIYKYYTLLLVVLVQWLCLSI